MVLLVENDENFAGILLDMAHDEGFKGIGSRSTARTGLISAHASIRTR